MKAFCCDLCETFERGAPACAVTIKPSTQTNAEALELCARCIVSLSDWQESRKPAQDAVSGLLAPPLPPTGGQD